MLKIVSAWSEDEGLDGLIRDFMGKLKKGFGEEGVREDVVGMECHDAIYFMPVFTGRDSAMGKAVEKRILELF